VGQLVRVGLRVSAFHLAAVAGLLLLLLLLPLVEVAN